MIKISFKKLKIFTELKNFTFNFCVFLSLLLFMHDASFIGNDFYMASNFLVSVKRFSTKRKEDNTIISDDTDTFLKDIDSRLEIINNLKVDYYPVYFLGFKIRLFYFLSACLFFTTLFLVVIPSIFP